jgi:large subunit ribosomal protein L18
MERPRLSVFKSNTRLSAQIINDETGKTLAFASSAAEKGKTPRERAEMAAATLAALAQKAGISKVVFDRGGYKYIGTIAAFAESARKSGLDF